MSSLLTDLLNAATVRLVTAEGDLLGTGFFAAEGIVLTCNHVLRGVNPNRVLCEWQGKAEPITDIILSDEISDVALLRVNHTNHVVPRLEPDWRPGDDVYTFGFSTKKPRGEAVTAKCEGLAYDSETNGSPLIKIKFGQVRPGLSGAPLLNLRTENVCGIVSRTRDKRSDLGGLAIQISLPLMRVPAEFQTSEESFEKWDAARSSSQVFRIDLAPILESHVIKRPEATRAVESFLLDEEGANEAIAVASFQGLAGIGKTTLATMLAQDETIIKKFPDATLWVTLGQTPDVVQGQLGWLDAFGRRAQSNSIEALTGLLRQLLRNKRCLLVIDDAWSADAVRPFLVGGKSCRTIITTRREEIAAEVEAKLNRLPQMTEREALSLIERRLGRDLGGTERVQAQRAMAAVENLPLALEQIAALVLKGTPWDRLNTDLRNEVKRLDALRDRSERLSGATSRVEAALRLSSDTLKREMPDVWACFVRLGLLADGAIITAAACINLWDRDEDLADTMLAALSADALLIPTGNVMFRRHSYRAYRLHDLFRDLARKLLAQEEPIGLAADLTLEHTAYLRRCRRAKSGLRRWQRLPDDGYIRGHLVWHMTKAWLPKTVMSLFRSRAWYDVRVERGSPRGYVRDLELAWEVADRKDGPRPMRERLRDQFRMALCYSSVHSISRTITPALIAQFVRHNLLAVDGALWYAETVSDPLLRLRVKLELCDWLEDDEAQRVLQDAVYEARFVSADEAPAIEREIVAMLARREFFDLLLRIVARSDRVKQVRILRIASDSTWPSSHISRIMVVLRPHEPTDRAEILIAALEAGNVFDDVLDEALAAVAAIPHDVHWLTRQLRLIPFTEGASRQHAFSGAMQCVSQLPDGAEEADALAALLNANPGCDIVEMYRSVAKRFSLSNQARILGRVALLMPESDAIALLDALLQRAASTPSVLFDVLDECMPAFAEKDTQLPDVWLRSARHAGSFDVLARLLANSGSHMPLANVESVVRLLISRLIGATRISAVICSWLESANEALIDELEKYLSTGALMDDISLDEACAEVAIAFGKRAATTNEAAPAALCELYARQVDDLALTIDLMGQLVDILGRDGAEYVAILDDAIETILRARDWPYYPVIARNFNHLSRAHRELFFADLFGMEEFEWTGGTGLREDLLSLLAPTLPKDVVHDYLNAFSGINDGSFVNAALQALESRADDDDVRVPATDEHRKLDALLRNAAMRTRQPVLQFVRRLLEEAIVLRDVEAAKAVVRIALEYANSTACFALIRDVLWSTELSQNVLEDLSPKLLENFGSHFGLTVSGGETEPLAAPLEFADHFGNLLPLLPLFSPNDRTNIIEGAMILIDRKGFDFIRRAVLAGLVWKFGGDVIPVGHIRAFSSSIRISSFTDDMVEFTRILRSLGPIMLPSERSDATRLLRTLEVNSSRSAVSIARAWVAMAPALGVEVLEEVLADLSPLERVAVLTSEIDGFRGDDRVKVLAFVEKITRSIVVPSQRFDAHLRLARVSSGQSKVAHISQMAADIGAAPLTADQTFSAAFLLSLLGPDARDDAWRQYLHRAAKNPRPEFLESIGSFRFFAAVHGGAKLWDKMSKVIYDTAQIWP